MDLLNPLFLICTLAMVMVTAHVATPLIGAEAEESRYASIDGLRGYLATFVFLHHSTIWFLFVRTGQWEAVESNLHRQLGKSSVALFFMITGFLFFLKLLNAKEKPIDWARLFISRVLRLTPLYLFTLTLMLVLVAVLSEFTLQDTPANLLNGLFRWVGFTFLGEPDLNGIQNTKLIVAGVFWTLPYEWRFYWALPLLALCLRRSVPAIYVALSAIVVISSVFKGPLLILLVPFLGGMAAAYLVQFTLLRQVATGAVATVVVMALLCITAIFYKSAEQLIPLALLFISFTIIACGNTCFGLLTNSAAKTLGQISYSIYLLHGLLLFVIFKFILGVERAATFSPTEHWLFISGCAASLILISCATFRWIEAPAMRRVPILTTWVRARTKREVG